MPRADEIRDVQRGGCLNAAGVHFGEPGQVPTVEAENLPALDMSDSR